MDMRLKNMLDRYQCHSQDDYINALKEIIQEIALLGLWCAKFFEKAAFYGDTALRIHKDVALFLRDPHSIALWSKQFFMQLITNKLQVVMH